MFKAHMQHAGIRQESRSLMDLKAFNEVLSGIADSPTRSKYTGLVLKMSASQLADFDVRIMCRVNSDPARLLLLAKELPDVACPMRQALCKDLLNQAPSAMHLTALKVRTTFAEEIKVCARQGTLAVPLFAIMATVAATWRPDSQDKF